MRKHKYKIIYFILFIILWAFLMSRISPDAIIDRLGEQNSYITLFILSFIGGVSVFIPFPFYLFTISLAIGGLNPYILGLVAASGTALGDTVSYLMGRIGGNFYEYKNKKVINKIKKFSEKQILFPVLLFIYASAAPFSDDLIMIPAGFLKIPYTKMIIPIYLGKIVFNTLMAFSAVYGWELLSSL